MMMTKIVRFLRFSNRRNFFMQASKLFIFNILVVYDISNT